MLKMGITIRLLGCFTILVATKVSPALCTIYGETIGENVANVDDDSVALVNNGEREKRSSKDAGFLIGENVPVWLAYRPDPTEPVQYTMLERGKIIKQAIDDWKALEPHGWNNTRLARSIKDDRLSIKIDDHEAFEARATSELLDSFDENKFSRSKRSVDRDVHVLVAMDYPSSWPTDESNQQKYIKEKILYAVAFWNAIHFRLKSTSNPRLRIRIAGIIIGRNKEATPYLRIHETEAGLDVTNAVIEMNNYWKNKSYTERDFPSDAHHVVATMTESKPPGGMAQWIQEGYGSTIGMLFCDDLAFGSLKGLHAISVKAGLEHWSRENVRYYPHLSSPGNPITLVPLPGQILSANKQCEARGWRADNKACYFWNPCTTLKCQNDIWYSRCSNSGPAIDGTFCRAERVCLGGECVLNSTLSY